MKQPHPSNRSIDSAWPPSGCCRCGILLYIIASTKNTILTHVRLRRGSNTQVHAKFRIKTKKSSSEFLSANLYLASFPAIQYVHYLGAQSYAAMLITSRSTYIHVYNTRPTFTWPHEKPLYRSTHRQVAQLCKLYK